MDIRISPEELNQHASNVVKYTNNITEKLDSVKAAIDSLAGWQSSNKELFVSKVQNEMTAMRQMVEAIESYGLVARDVAARVVNVENSIRESIMKDSDFAA